MHTETLDKLYLELSHVSSAKTARELTLEAEVEKLRKQLTRPGVEQAVNWLNRAAVDASMERSEFGLMWTNLDDPLPANEKEVTDFIRRRTRLWRSSWVIGPIEEAVKILTAK